MKARLNKFISLSESMKGPIMALWQLQWTCAIAPSGLLGRGHELKTCVAGQFGGLVDPANAFKRMNARYWAFYRRYNHLSQDVCSLSTASLPSIVRSSACGHVARASQARRPSKPISEGITSLNQPSATSQSRFEPREDLTSASRSKDAGSILDKVI